MTAERSQRCRPVLIGGLWCESDATETFHATNPATAQPLEEIYPISSWRDVERALNAATAAFSEMRQLPAVALADFLRRYADNIEQRTDEIVATAALETGLPVEPRLKNIELPRTTDQLRLAADASLDPAWRMPTIDPTAKIASILEPIGPVLVLGPNNFPFAYNGIAGGDFAAAIAAGNPVIAKAHPLHPSTSRLLAEAAFDAIGNELPKEVIQMIYGVSPDDGLRMAGDPRLGAIGFTGSRMAGTALKKAADAVGKPIFLEMSSVNPVIILPGALAERADEIVNDAVTSGLMAAGQFCTNPGLMITCAGPTTEGFISSVAEKYSQSPCGTLLGKGVLDGLQAGITALTRGGASIVTGGSQADRDGFAFENTVLRVDGKQFLASAEQLQTEAFGNGTLIVVAENVAQVAEILSHLEGSLTGCIYSATDGSEDETYRELAGRLVTRIGRLLNDKMPTGVAVSPAMNHGGPFPATGHPHFTAVGVPASLRRFTRLTCYDNVRPHRLPEVFGTLSIQTRRASE